MTPGATAATNARIRLVQGVGNYPRKKAIAAIDADGLLPDMLSYNP